jgi:hypothetical protein
VVGQHLTVRRDRGSAGEGRATIGGYLSAAGKGRLGMFTVLHPLLEKGVDRCGDIFSEERARSRPPRS